MKTTQQINLPIAVGFIGKPVRATQTTVLASCNECTGIAQDTKLVLYSGSSANTMEKCRYFNPEDNAYEDACILIPSGQSSGQLRFTDISIGEYFQFKIEVAGSGNIGNLKVNY